MISGATGGAIGGVVVVSLVATHGVEYLFAAVVLMGGLIQIAAGILRLGKFVRMILILLCSVLSMVGYNHLSCSAESVQN